MKKVFILKGLDCPHCSAEIEKEVGKLDGVSESVVNLMNQTLTVNVSEHIADKVGEDIERIVHSHEPDVEIVEQKEEKVVKKETDEETKKAVLKIAVGAAVYAAAIVVGGLLKLPLPVYLAILIISYIILGGDVILKAVKNIIKGRIFDENFLMSISTVCAFIIGEYPEAVAVMLFYQIGEFFQGLAVKRSRRSISELMDIRPDSATVIRHGKAMIVHPENVQIGETITVKPGEKIPIDGIVTDGISMIDTAALTGESVPRSVKKGDEVLSGSINMNGVLTVKTEKTYGESTVSKIIELVENASSKKAPTENFITTFARYYTPAVVIFAAFLAIIPPLFFNGVWADWLHRGFVFLVISCPCALVISIPLAFFGGIGAASRHGILIKGGNHIEALTKTDTVVFDKTGTLTKGVFNVSKTVTANGTSEKELLETASKAESMSSHPIARSICERYPSDDSGVTSFEEISGFGIKATVNSSIVLVGNEKLMEIEKIDYVKNEEFGSKAYVAKDGMFLGCIIISDGIKEDSKTAVSMLKKIGIKRTVMLTGDNVKTAEKICKELNIDEYHAELLPDKKVDLLEKLCTEKKTKGKVIFVGDGINDAPVIARADIGMAMGGMGSDAAIEAADVVIMNDEPSKIADSIKLAKDTKSIVIQNILISFIIKGIFLLLGALGYASMWQAVFGDVGVALIAVLNSMRLLKK
ncbi:MAG: cadmium-translocating P-type ATPase [Ruminococcaceae bacterium]|nr:cadmium-translocating P-type ATPase [Oscillospiraceae bacterium]